MHDFIAFPIFNRAKLLLKFLCLPKGQYNPWLENELIPLLGGGDHRVHDLAVEHHLGIIFPAHFLQNDISIGTNSLWT